MATKRATKNRTEAPAVQVATSYFKTHDQHRLYFESHLPQNPKAILIVVHGFSEHAGRYKSFIDAFSDQYGVYVFDLRGHGRSDGIRAHVHEFEDFIEDLNLFVDMVHKCHKGIKKFLVAHSMGGQISLNYLAKYPANPLTGFITSSANIKVAVPIHPIKRYLGIALSHFFPTLRLDHEINTKWISSNPAAVRDFEEDPLVHPNITVNLARHILENQDDLVSKAEKIKIPALMLHGDQDRICALEGTNDFFAGLKSKDKTKKIYPGMYHEIFNEREKEKVFADIHKWVEKRV